MKKILLLVSLFLGCTFLFAQKQSGTDSFNTGDIIFYYPKGVQRLKFANDVFTEAICTKIAKDSNGSYILEITAPSLSNKTVDGTYPVTVSYSIEPGTVIELYFEKGDDVQLNSIEFTKIQPNHCEFNWKVIKVYSSSTNTPAKPETDKQQNNPKQTSPNKVSNKEQYEEWTLDQVAMLRKKNVGKKVLIKSVYISFVSNSYILISDSKSGSETCTFDDELINEILKYKKLSDENYGYYINIYGYLLNNTLNAIHIERIEEIQQ